MLLPSVRIGINTHLKMMKLMAAEHEDPHGRAARILAEDESADGAQGCKEYTASSPAWTASTWRAPARNSPAVRRDDTAQLPLRRPSAGCPAGLPPRIGARAPASSIDGSASSRRTRPLQASSRSNSSWKCVRAPRNGPKCVRNSVSGSHARMRSALTRQASRSISGGGVGGMTYDPVASPDSGRVADEGHAARSIEVADVVRGVPGRLRHLELSPSGRQPLVAVQDLDRAPQARAGRHPTSGPCPRRRGGVALAMSFDGSIRCRAPRSCTNTSISGFACRSVPVAPA